MFNTIIVAYFPSKLPILFSLSFIFSLAVVSPNSLYSAWISVCFDRINIFLHFLNT